MLLPIDAALATLAETEQLLVAVDFDGTLAPFVDAPDEARAVPAALDAIGRLVALPRTRVAFVSGRALASLETVAQADDSVLLVGSHGAEFKLEGAPSHPPLSESEQQLLADLLTNVRSVTERYPGVWIEQKPAGFAIHTRQVAADEATSVVSEARELVTRFAGVTSRDGKDVLEFSVVAATKGDGVLRLKNYTAATAVLYAGDDVTDEDAFAVLSGDDLAVKCGDGETIAPFRVGGPVDMAELLSHLADYRAAHTASR